MEQCALFPLFCGMGFGSVRWFTHIVFVLSVRWFFRSFVSLLCHHIISISWEIHIFPDMSSFFSQCDEIIYFAHSSWCGFCVFDFSPWCDHDYSHSVCMCVCVCVWVRCWVKTCVTKWQSLRINTMTGCNAENFFDYWSILGHLVCHFQASPPFPPHSFHIFYGIFAALFVTKNSVVW